MISTSSEYKEAIKKNREFSIHDIYTLTKNSIKIEMETGDFLAYSIDDCIEDSENYVIGTISAKEYKATLNNFDGKFDGVEFKGARIEAKLGIKLFDGTIEKISKGFYTICSAVFTETSVEITAYDDMVKFDVPYTKSKLEFPSNLKNIISDACQNCDVSIDISKINCFFSLEGEDFRIEKLPEKKDLTFRDMLQYCAKLMLSCWRIADTGKLVSVPFPLKKMGEVQQNFNGGRLKKYFYAPEFETKAVGGFLDNIDSGDMCDGGLLKYTSSFVHAYDLINSKIESNNFYLTGLRIQYNDDDREVIKNVIWTTDVHLDTDLINIQNNFKLYALGGYYYTSALDREFKVLYTQYLKDMGVIMRPFSIVIKSDPSIEVGDVIVITDRHQNSFYSMITHSKFTFGAAQILENNCNCSTVKVRDLES